MKNPERLSKFLALALRHEPEKFGITLDKQGFTDVEHFWTVIQSRFGQRYSWQDLLDVVAGDATGKKRYEIRQSRIRAMYSHNRTVAIDYPPAVPPELLYHGTNEKALADIRQAGLKSLGRQFVHLTTSTQRAENVARRRGEKTVLLTIRALEAHQAGLIFHHPEDEHYLVKAVPPQFIVFP